MPGLHDKQDITEERSSRCLQLNADKTEVIWFGSRATLRCPRRNLLCGSVLPSFNRVASVRNLDVYVDSELTMSVHIGKVSSACFFNLRRLRRLRYIISTYVMQRCLRLLWYLALTTAIQCLRDCPTPHNHHFGERWMLRSVWWQV